MRNANVPSGTVKVVASASPVNYIGLTVISLSDLTYVDSLGQTTTLVGVQPNIFIRCQIVVVSTCTGDVLGHQP